MVEQHFCLRWNNYRTNITAEFETLREGEHFVDVTLACDGKQLKAHKVVLSACSPYFKELLQANPCSHPIIILRDVAYIHMRSLLEFMYAGEVNISQAHLGSFLHTAEALKIRGLAESSEDRKDQTRGCNSLSPLTALKTSLSNLGGISLCGLGPSMLERSLISHLPGYSHSGDSPTSNTKQSAPPQRVPTNLSLPSTSFTSPPPNSSCGALSTNSGSSFSKALSIEMQGPISLTTNSHMNDLSSRIKVEVNNEQKGSTSPLSLPPNKRIRLDPKIGLSKDNGPERLYENSQNGSSFTSTSSVSPADTATSKLSTSITASDTEDAADTVPKTEPLEPPASDTEGSGGCPEDGESGNGALGGRESPPDRAPSNSTSGIAISDSENASHLLQALSSESHLPGLPLEEERHFAADDCRQEVRASSSPPLPPSSLPHSCHLCGKLISCRRNLWKHMERVHFTNPAVRCSLCFKMFKNKYALKDHQRIYHGGLSEPSQMSPTPRHSPSLLSRILQDPRNPHQQVSSHPQDLSANASPSSSPLAQSSSHLQLPISQSATYTTTIHLPPLDHPPISHRHQYAKAQHEEYPCQRPPQICGETSYSNLRMPPGEPHSPTHPPPPPPPLISGTRPKLSVQHPSSGSQKRVSSFL